MTAQEMNVLRQAGVIAQREADSSLLDLKADYWQSLANDLYEMTKNLEPDQ